MCICDVEDVIASPEFKWSQMLIKIMREVFIVITSINSLFPYMGITCLIVFLELSLYLCNKNMYVVYLEYVCMRVTVYWAIFRVLSAKTNEGSHLHVHVHVFFNNVWSPDRKPPNLDSNILNANLSSIWYYVVIMYILANRIFDTF